MRSRPGWRAWSRAQPFQRQPAEPLRSCSHPAGLRIGRALSTVSHNASQSRWPDAAGTSTVEAKLHATHCSQSSFAHVQPARLRLSVPAGALPSSLTLTLARRSHRWRVCRAAPGSQLASEKSLPRRPRSQLSRPASTSWSRWRLGAVVCVRVWWAGEEHGALGAGIGAGHAANLSRCAPSLGESTVPPLTAASALRQGDHGDVMYVVESGELVVKIDGVELPGSTMGPAGLSLIRMACLRSCVVVVVPATMSMSVCLSGYGCSLAFSCHVLRLVSCCLGSSRLVLSCLVCDHSPTGGPLWRRLLRRALTGLQAEPSRPSTLLCRSPLQ